jgi:hypothetical protein
MLGGYGLSSVDTESEGGDSGDQRANANPTETPSSLAS